MNRSELFARACEINQLRRLSQLPARNTLDLMAAEEDRFAWEEYTRVVGQYQPVFQQLRQKVRQEFINAEKSSLMSAGGRWLLQYKAMKLFEEFLEGKGHFRPMLRGIPYGSRS